jgi:signal transduction histidine kinase
MTTIRRAASDPRLLDGVLALVLSIVGLASMSATQALPGFRAMDPLGAALILLATAPIAVRRRWPLWVLLVSGTATIALSAFGYDNSGGIATLFALYTVAAHTERAVSLRALALTGAGILLTIGLEVGRFDIRLPNIVASYLVFATVWLIGNNLRTRRAYLAQLDERAMLLEREREEQAARAVAEERSRIARELHDVVAHHVSVMVVQAAGARRVLDRDPAEAAEALAAVEDTGRQALVEMRRMVGVLRAGRWEDSRSPLPGLDRLDELLTQVREAGLPVELLVEGEPRSLPAGVDLSAYRIVQEALTNSLRHAGRATSRVRLHYGPGDLAITIADDGRGALATTRGPGAHRGYDRGHGLVGMRERVALFGGRLEAGPGPAGGYVVSAWLPVDGVAGGGGTWASGS